MMGINASYTTLGLLLLTQILIGGGAGFLLGRIIQLCVNNIKLESALYPIFVIGVVLSGFAITNMLGGSGFMAVYIAGLLAGNSRIQAHAQILKFQQTITWLSQITMFTCLGLFVSFSGLKQYWQPAVLLGFLLMFIARPIMIWTLLSFFKRYSSTEKNFISFVGLRGATSILLALTPIVYQLDFADAFFNIIFVMVLMSLSIQGFFIPMMARKCQVIVPSTQVDPAEAEVDLPGLVDSSLILYQLTEKSPAVLGESIPRWAQPSLVVRNGIAYFSGRVLKRLQDEDKVYVFLPSNSRRAILDHLYGNGEDEQLQDIFGDFPIDPQTTFNELALLYGIKIPEHIRSLTIAEFIQRELSDIEIGDRFSLGTVELVVRSLQDGKLTGIDLDIDPTRHHSYRSKKLEIDKSKYA